MRWLRQHGCADDGGIDCGDVCRNDVVRGDVSRSDVGRAEHVDDDRRAVFVSVGVVVVAADHRDHSPSDDGAHDARTDHCGCEHSDDRRVDDRRDDDRRADDGTHDVSRDVDRRSGHLTPGVRHDRHHDSRRERHGQVVLPVARRH